MLSPAKQMNVRWLGDHCDRVIGTTVKLRITALNLTNMMKTAK